MGGGMTDGPVWLYDLGMSATIQNRRTFARRLGLAGSAVLLRPSLSVADTDSQSWAGVRRQFLIPANTAFINAANLCPAPSPVLDAVFNARDLDHDLSPPNRTRMHDVKEATRGQLAEFLRVSPDEIVITRNTSESNNLVSSGLDLKPGDEVLLFSDNHPSNHRAWTEKAKRWGFTVKFVPQVNPHPGGEYYVDAFTREMTARTKLLGVTHLTSTVGDLMPVRELCRAARQRGMLTLVDGAQSFGLMDVDLSDLQPDFYSGSGHKWLCGPKETGVLYVRKDVQSRLWPSIFSAYPGAVGISRNFEAFGQRDDAAILGLGEALKFHNRIGRQRIEQHSRDLAGVLVAGLAKMEGVKMWTSRDAARRHSVVSFQPGSLDPNKAATALHERDGIICATRGGTDRPGLRLSPHLYNSEGEVERALAAMQRILRAGV